MTVGAAIKRIVILLLTNPSAVRKVLVALLCILLAVILPTIGVVAILQGDLQIDTDALQQAVEAQMTEADIETLQHIEDTMHSIDSAMSERHMDVRQTQAAQMLYILALYDQSGEDDFVTKLADCFTQGESDEKLISAVNATYGSNIDPAEWSLLMASIHPDIVTIALQQVGNVGGEPYWSWYGFTSRVEWCACFVSWCADQCGYIDAGIMPRTAGCVQGTEWFRERDLWHNRDYVPSPGDIIYFDWDGSYGQDGLPDHVGIVERSQDGWVYTVEGNSGDACRQRQYAVGYYEIYGYGTPLYNGPVQAENE